MDDGNFDVLIVGTGLTESITAAALAKAGFKVAHIDENSYYGADEASLSLDEFVQWADSQASGSNSKFTSVTHSPEVPSQSRQYSICLRPSVIPSIGPIISSLVSSGVAKYGGFRLLERVGVYDPSGVVTNVPRTKEDVFKSKDISLVDKRRLMRFLMFAVGDFEDKKELEGAQDMPFEAFLKNVFSLNDDITSMILYSLAFCFSSTDHTLPALERIRRYLRSAGRYGPSPFLVGHYGGSGEIAQGFCRAAAVSGGVYILGRRIISITHASLHKTDSEQPDSQSSPHYSITLEDFPDTMTAKVIVSSASHVPPHLVSDTKRLRRSAPESEDANASIARCIAIIDQAICFPPSALPLNQEPTTTEEDSDEASAPDSSEFQSEISLPQPLDAGIIVFPPASVVGGSITTAAAVLVTGEGTMSTPKGKWIVYIGLPLSSPLPSSISAESLLKPYLDAVLTLAAPPNDPATSTSLPTPPVETPSPHPESASTKPLFTSFYIEHPTPDSPLHTVDPESTQNKKTYIIPTPLLPASSLPDTPDDAAINAEAAFWEVIKVLQQDGGKSDSDVSGKMELDRTDDASEGVSSFWPPLEREEESGGEEEW
ncbi:Rab proteins geranylgeranyltransferase component A [Hypsizygus marmoreus]|uniref:Rab proteins geranylgeranyltransferase component A n=1 Tax=Hypsizygus marmoreus TaxID=39966 RepID=A0A369J270_HYPMA|nr:Rab proteins geranylgeranyltransferase component A [Hypsizygus marmoreus]